MIIIIIIITTTIIVLFHLLRQAPQLGQYLYFGILVWKPEQTPCPILIRGVVIGWHQQMLQAPCEVCLCCQEVTFGVSNARGSTG